MIIGITGKAQTGKDTIAKYLIEKYSFKRYAFANPIKDICNYAFGWNSKHTDGDLKETTDPYWGFSPRQAYQLLGTEFGRALNPDLWVLMAKKEILDERLSDINWVISDVRFENEAKFIRENNGRIIHVFRENAAKVNEHVSESGIDIYLHDEAIANNGTIDDLNFIVSQTMERLLYGRVR